MEYKIRNLIKNANKLTKSLTKTSIIYQYFDQTLAQNTSLDHITTYKSQQQLKSSPTVMYESKKDLKIRNLIKNANKLIKILPKITAF